MFKDSTAVAFFDSIESAQAIALAHKGKVRPASVLLVGKMEYRKEKPVYAVHFTARNFGRIVDLIRAIESCPALTADPWKGWRQLPGRLIERKQAVA